MVFSLTVIGSDDDQAKVGLRKLSRTFEAPLVWLNVHGGGGGQEGEVAERLSKFDDLEEDCRRAQEAVAESNNALASEIARVAAALMPEADQRDHAAFITSVAELLEEAERQVNAVLEEVHWSEPDLQVRRNASLDRWTSRLAQDHNYGGIHVVGVLGELLCVNDEGMAAALVVQRGSVCGAHATHVAIQSREG